MCKRCVSLITRNRQTAERQRRLLCPFVPVSCRLRRRSTVVPPRPSHEAPDRDNDTDPRISCTMDIMQVRHRHHKRIQFLVQPASCCDGQDGPPLNLTFANVLHRQIWGLCLDDTSIEVVVVRRLLHREQRRFSLGLEQHQVPRASPRTTAGRRRSPRGGCAPALP